MKTPRHGGRETRSFRVKATVFWRSARGPDLDRLVLEMAKSKAAPISAAPSSNWKSLRAVRVQVEASFPPSRRLNLLDRLQALNPAVAAAATIKDSNKRKRRHSSVTSVDSTATGASGRSVKAKGKERAVEPNDEDAAPREKGKRVRANKQLVPVDEIMKGGSAPWQQE